MGGLTKQFDVVGNRTWEQRLLGGLRPSAPIPFTKKITYDVAYGGVDDSNPGKVTPYLPNPVGVGYHPRRARSEIAGLPVPNTEELGASITSVKGKYRPMSFGPIGRSWSDRLPYAGTYDDDWTENVFPFLPSDFDDRYFQSAPLDQQLAAPNGGELMRIGQRTGVLAMPDK